MNRTLAGGLAAAALFTTTLAGRAQTLAPDEAKAIAEEAYIYGYSLITTEVKIRPVMKLE